MFFSNTWRWHSRSLTILFCSQYSSIYVWDEFVWSLMNGREKVHRSGLLFFVLDVNAALVTSLGGDQHGVRTAMGVGGNGSSVLWGKFLLCATFLGGHWCSQVHFSYVLLLVDDCNLVLRVFMTNLSFRKYRASGRAFDNRSANWVTCFFRATRYRPVSERRQGNKEVGCPLKRISFFCSLPRKYQTCTQLTNCMV